jgi:hypothetical protein
VENVAGDETVPDPAPSMAFCGGSAYAYGEIPASREDSVEPTSWLKAKDVMFAALARPAEEREAFVRERCADPAVCAEILEVLATAPGTAEQLSRSARAPAPGDEQPAESLLELGTSVGPYVIVDRIGRGGMGQVFLGTDPRLQRRVALKCLLDSRAGADVRSRIIHEARAAARISSQHVAVVHDVLEHEARAFIVMEYVEGETLAARIRKGPLPAAAAIAIGRQIAAALAAAHAEGIVHRDLKPGNVQVTPSGVVKILDFGIASATRLLTPALPASAASGAGVDTGAPIPRLAGTAPYMSPEQLLGRQIDERSDLYSLGTVLFEMCTGQRAYPGRDAIEIAVAQATSTPRADAIDAAIPRPLADLIARAMAIDADERFASATEMDAALAQVERALAEPTLSRRERAARLAVRAAVGLPVAAAAITLVGMITTLQFNGLFGRDGEFARFGREPWLSWIRFGLLGVVPVIVVMTIGAVAAVAIRFMFGLLLLVRPLRTIANQLRSAAGRLVDAAGLNRSTPAAQALTGLAVATLAVFFWRYSALVGAFTSFFNSSPLQQLLPMTDSAPARTQYHIELGLITLVFGFALSQVLKLRRRERARDGLVAVAMLAVVVATMVLLNEIPYRAFHHRDFERVDLAGARCYLTGQSGDELLVLCPGSPPPRNRVVRRDDPRLRRLGIIENVFKGIDPAAAPH